MARRVTYGDCPDCGATLGEPCVFKSSGKPMKTKHWSRVKIRRKTAEERLDELETALARRGTLLRNSGNPGILIKENRPAVTVELETIPLHLGVEMTKPKGPATKAEVRQWARNSGIEVATRGRLKPDVIEAFKKKTRREVV